MKMKNKKINYKPYIFLVLLAMLGGLVLIIGKKVDMHGGIPFGPSMLLGIWLGIFVGAPIATLYLQVTGLA